MEEEDGNLEQATCAVRRQTGEMKEGLESIARQLQKKVGKGQTLIDELKEKIRAGKRDEVKEVEQLNKTIKLVKLQIEDAATEFEQILQAIFDVMKSRLNVPQCTWEGQKGVPPLIDRLANISHTDLQKGDFQQEETIEIGAKENQLALTNFEEAQTNI
eukprot:GHVT01009919.1.p1 GENE.GHVT01009919.1~~GHVT01009919.1.p1  ORF type:complete len:159 (-),score=47.61 GHVT01009919.1:156-632(-)